jgi:Na+/H+ antiporter NhaD/arsenite permease-like protein
VLVLVFLGLCRRLFADVLHADPDKVDELMSLNERQAIRDRRLLVESLVVLGVALAAFMLHPVLHYEPSVVALLGAGLLIVVTRVSTEQALQDVEWPCACRKLRPRGSALCKGEG